MDARAAAVGDADTLRGRLPAAEDAAAVATSNAAAARAAAAHAAAGTDEDPKGRHRRGCRHLPRPGQDHRHQCGIGRKARRAGGRDHRGGSRVGGRHCGRRRHGRGAVGARQEGSGRPRCSEHCGLRRTPRRGDSRAGCGDGRGGGQEGPFSAPSVPLVGPARRVGSRRRGDCGAACGCCRLIVASAAAFEAAGLSTVACAGR